MIIVCLRGFQLWSFLISKIVLLIALTNVMVYRRVQSRVKLGGVGSVNKSNKSLEFSCLFSSRTRNPIPTLISLFHQKGQKKLKKPKKPGRCVTTFCLCSLPASLRRLQPAVRPAFVSISVLSHGDAVSLWTRAEPLFLPLRQRRGRDTARPLWSSGCRGCCKERARSCVDCVRVCVSAVLPFSCTFILALW